MDTEQGTAWRREHSLHTVDLVPRVEVSQEEEVQELLGHIFILIQNVLEEQHVDRVMNSNTLSVLTVCDAKVFRIMVCGGSQFKRGLV